MCGRKTSILPKGIKNRRMDISPSPTEFHVFCVKKIPKSHSVRFCLHDTMNFLKT